jgi:hypothetical protein
VDGKTKERWLELCEQASKEQGPKKLMELVEEIDRVLKEKSAIILLSSLTTSRLLASDKHGIVHFGHRISVKLTRCVSFGGRLQQFLRIARHRAK